MRDPTRWLESDSDVDPSVRDLLSAAAPPPPMPRDDRASLGAFVAGLGKVAPPVAPWWHAASLLKAGALAGALVGGAAAVHHVATHHAPARAPRHHARAASVTVAPVIAAPVAPEITAPAPEITAPAPVASAVVAAATRPHHHAARASDDETALLEDARGAIASGAHSHALRQLARHAERYPDSTLSEERTFLRVRALVGAGRRDAASSLARSYLDAHPGGLYAARVRELLGPR